MLARRPLFLVGLLGTFVLAVLFFSVLRREDATLGTPFVEMSILPDVRWSETRYTEGTTLRGDLSEQTLTPAGSLYLLEGTVRVPPNTTVRIAPETRIAAADGARMVVEGTLDVDRATFTNNHLHPDRRLWHGLVAERGGTITLRNSSIAYASAGMTCAAGGSIHMTAASIGTSAAGVVTLPGCTSARIADLHITDSRVGLYLLGGAPAITNVTLTRVFDGIRVFHEARPTMTGLTARTLQHAIVVYAAEPNLLIRELTFPRGVDTSALIFDGTNVKTHRWHDREYPTGRVIVQ